MENPKQFKYLALSPHNVEVYFQTINEEIFMLRFKIKNDFFFYSSMNKPVDKEQ